MKPAIVTFASTVAVLTCSLLVASDSAETPTVPTDASGNDIMFMVYERHELYPYVFEKQSMILIDALGKKRTRKLRRFSRVDEAGNANFLLIFDAPAEIRGVALVAKREPSGETSQSFFLPAFGDVFFKSIHKDERAMENFLGSDFSIADLIGEDLESHTHVRRPGQVIDEVEYYVIDVYEGADAVPEETLPTRRHFILKKNLYITRTDHFDDLGRLKKRQTHHDLVNVHGQMWRANMIMMVNLQRDHRSVLKINERVFSADYVPMKVFEKSWIRANAQRPAPVGQGDSVD